jgi:hypothetical protein
MPKYYLIERWTMCGVDSPPNSDREVVTIHGFDDLEKLIEVYKKGSKRYKGEYIPVQVLDELKSR